MQKHSDEALVAYLDGELDIDERAHVEAWLDADPAVLTPLLAAVQKVARAANKGSGENKEIAAYNHAVKPLSSENAFL